MLPRRQYLARTFLYDDEIMTYHYSSLSFHKVCLYQSAESNFFYESNKNQF